MSEFDILKKVGSSDNTEEAPEKKLTLESIMREYDAKKAQENKKFEEELESEELKAFKKEVDSMAAISSKVQSTEDEHEKAHEAEDYDDSDMKIADAPKSIDESDDPFAKTAEPVTDERKINIMNEISRRFENPQKEEVSEVSSEQVEQDSEEACKNAGEEDAEAVPSDKGGMIGKIFAVGGSKVDDESLKEAFKDDDYDTSKGKKKRKVRRGTWEIKQENNEAPASDNTEVETGEEASPDEDGEARAFGRYDRNGERIVRDNGLFKPTVTYKPGDNTSEYMTLMQKKLLGSCISVIAVAIITLFCLYTEFAPTLGLPHIKALEPGKLGVVFILFDLQLMFFAAIIKLGSLAKGALALFGGTPIPESVATVSVFAAALHAIVCAFTADSTAKISLFCSVGCVLILMLAISDFMKAKTEFVSFRLISSENPMIALKDLADSKEETSDCIHNYVPEFSSILDSRSIGFADEFFERNAKPCSLDIGIGKSIIASLIVSVVSAAAYYFFNKSVLDAFCGLIAVFVVSVQSCTLLSSVLPEYIFAQRAARRKCAFVGHDICEEYDNVSVISFKDTEVFDPTKIQVTNIRTYGDARIDNIIVTMARIFNKIGGPLSEVFKNSISGISVVNEGVKIIDVASDGIWLDVDGEKVYLGTATYMQDNNFETPVDMADSSFTLNNSAILYLACSNKILAKFYIKYDINTKFENILSKLRNYHICARIKTLDPCINADFIRASLRRTDYVFSIVKARDPEEFNRHEESLSSGVVSLSNENSLIQAFLLVKLMEKVIRKNNAIKIIATVISLSVAALMLVAGSLAMSTAVVLILQLLFSLSVIVNSKLS